MMRRMTRLAAGVAAALMMAAGSASAAETVGSDLAGSPSAPSFGQGFTETHLTQRTGASLPVTASAPGVIVQIKIRHSDAPQNATGGWSILSGTFPNFTARTSTGLPDFSWTNAQPAGIRTLAFNPGVPIAAGERLAYRSVAGNSPGIVKVDSPGAQGAGRAGMHTSDQQAYSGPFMAFEHLWQMRIEPDVDIDGLGDESQDNSPSACAGLTVTKFGTSGDDAIFGTDGNDVISTGGGNDVVRSLGGDDIVCGGEGNDKLKGGAGKDRLFGEAGRDKLNGGGSKDYCKGGADKDAIGCEKAKQN